MSTFSGKNQEVSFFLPSLSGGGMEKMTIRIAKEFAKRGVKTSIVLTTYEGEYKSKVPAGVEVYDLSASYMMLSIPSLVRYVKSHNVKKLVSIGRVCNIIALMSRRLGGLEDLEVTISLRNVESKKKDGIIRKIYRGIAKCTYSSADKITAISEAVLDDHLGFINSKEGNVKVIYNPALSVEVMKMGKKSVDHPWLKSGVPVILAVGRLVEQKNFSMLIKAFRRVRQQRRCKLIILGKGPKKEDMKKIARRHGVWRYIDMPGFKSNPYKYMKQSDIFVLSSKWEGFGNVIVEAMAQGTPIVSTNCEGGVSEILEDGKWGKLVPVNSIDRFASEILNTLESGGETDTKERASDFRVEKVADEYLSLIFDQDE